MEQFTSFKDLAINFSEKLDYAHSGWYKGYKETHHQLLEDPISDSSLELVWYTRDNSVASLRQGSPSKNEFEQSKEIFREISRLISKSQDSETYKLAQNKLKQAKKDGLLSKMYWALLNRAFAAFSPTLLTSTIDTESFKTVIRYLNKQFGFNVKLDGNWLENNIRFKNEISKHLPADYDPYFLNMAIWHIFEALTNEASNNTINEPKLGNYQNMIITSLNQILYGPPGTGKTYHTVEASVKAAEPSFIPNSENKDDIRKAYKAKYDELVKAGRIRFVTFHQSYGYEEFVEGLSAKTEGDQLSYFEKDGIFKTICDEAKSYRVAINESILSSFDQRWQLFAEYLAESESGIVIKTLSKKTYFTITDVTNNTIRFDKSKGSSIHSLSVKTLKAVYYKEKQIVGGLQPYYGAFIEHLNQFDLPVTKAHTERKNFVLIIDEINRGNISKIFGELITLIEPSKRLGQAESIEAILPYSGDLFSVPDNLYLIGTMNTADRSLALMDTALRRRFDFVEMMPDYLALSDDKELSYSIGDVETGINLVNLLQTLNKRITALYDREHTLGHAFLMPVVDKIKQGEHQAALTELAKCFQNKIIPLLAEYFYEDWQKIRLVLGDNQKSETTQLVKKQSVVLESLFGDTEDIIVMDDDASEYQLFAFNLPRWQDPQTYIGIYSPNKLPE